MHQVTERDIIFNANASGDREGYSPSNASHMSMVDDRFPACVAAIKGTLVSPRTPSWIDTQTGKGARLDHLVGLGVEFTCASGRAVWVGLSFQDHDRVSFTVNIGTPKVKDTNIDKKECHQTMTLKQWQGISHLIDEPLKNLAMQSLERLSEKDFPGPRNSGSGDSGYGFVDLGGQLESNQVWVEGPALVASAYGPSTEGAGTRVCGYAIKNSGLTVV